MRPVDQRGILIPLYIYPEPSMQYTRKRAEEHGDTDHHGVFDWQLLLDLHRKYPGVPLVVIANPINGPGTVADTAYSSAISAFTKAGIRVVGYVSTKYAGMVSSIGVPQYPLSEIRRDVDAWYRFYPMIDGIFFDEMARGFDTKVYAYYRQASAMARERGAELVIMNPGLSINYRWHTEDIADIFVTWEKDLYPTVTEAVTDYDYAQVTGPAGARRGCLVMGRKFRRHEVKWILKPYYDWVYVTPTPLEPNPWNVLDAETLRKLFKILAR